jgi:hypothetical protein
MHYICTWNLVRINANQNDTFLGNNASMAFLIELDKAMIGTDLRKLGRTMPVACFLYCATPDLCHSSYHCLGIVRTLAMLEDPWDYLLARHEIWFHKETVPRMPTWKIDEAPW